MADQERRRYLRTTYVRIAIYLLPSEDARVEPGIPACVDPDGLSSDFASGLDVAPYATIEPTERLLTSVRFEIELAGRRSEDQGLVDSMRDFESWLLKHVASCPYAAIQREPAAIAGFGTASVETDPNLPPEA